LIAALSGEATSSGDAELHAPRETTSETATANAATTTRELMEHC
jgi:hypothetical protein